MLNVRSVVVTAGVLTLMFAAGPRPAIAQSQPVVACVKPGSGTVRILPPGETCKDQEVPVAFNDFPLLVALAQQLGTLQTTVATLQGLVQTLEARVEALEQCAALICAAP